MKLLLVSIFIMLLAAEGCIHARTADDLSAPERREISELELERNSGEITETVYEMRKQAVEDESVTV